jgi:hypothetical protein
MPNKGNETCHIFINRIPPSKSKQKKTMKYFFRGIFNNLSTKHSGNASETQETLRNIGVSKTTESCEIGIHKEPE